MEKEIKEEMSKSDGGKAAAPKEKNTTMAIIAYVVFFIPLLTEAKTDPFVKYHVKQGMALFVTWIACAFIGMVPLLGWMVSQFLSVVMLVLMVIGIMNAYNGKEVPLPVIGKYADSIKI